MVRMAQNIKQNKMNTLTNEQVGLQIAKQTINKLNKNMMVDISKTKFELVEIKGAFASK
jgi:hypothetical protein